MALCRRWFIQKDLDVVLSRSVLALPTYLIVPTLSVGLSTRIVLWKIHVVCLESQNDKSSETRALELTTVTLLVHLIFFYYSFVNTRLYFLIIFSFKIFVRPDTQRVQPDERDRQSTFESFPCVHTLIDHTRFFFSFSAMCSRLGGFVFSGSTSGSFGRDYRCVCIAAVAFW